MEYNNPHLTAFIEGVDRNLQVLDPATLWNCEESLKTLLDSGFVAELLKQELRKLIDEPSYIGDWQPKQMMVHRGNGYSLSISLLEETRRYIHTIPCYALYAPVGMNALSFDRYELPAEYRNDVFNPSVLLKHLDSGILKPNNILSLDPRRYAYDFKISSTVLLLKFAMSPVDTLEWLFSKDTLHAWQANDATMASTQLRVAAYVLGRLAHQTSLEPLSQLSSHPHHAVRWAAIQSLGRLSRTVAIKKLEAALDDPHPHVSSAAEKTLRQLTNKARC